MLEGFEVMSPFVGAPSMSVNNTGLAFNKATVEKLKQPEYVQIMINRSLRLIAIKVCGQEDSGSRMFLKRGRDSKQGVRWNNYDLKSEISDLMNWNLIDEGKKIKGEYSAEDNAIIFDLKDAIPLPTRNRGGSNE